MLGILLVVLLLIFTGFGISHASNVEVIGGGSDEGGTIPTINPRQVSLPSPRDPSQYDHPKVPILPNPSDSSNKSGSNYLNVTSSPTIQFRMTSNVKGSSIGSPARGAGFSQWRYMQDGDGLLKAKQTSSALYGNLDETRQIVFLNDKQESSTENISTALILSQDQIRFFGASYRDNVNYLNEGDLVRNSFESGNISKNSTYLGWFEDYNMNDENETGHLRTSTLYNINSINVGISNLDLISRSENGSTEIFTSEQYTGEIALRINFRNNLNMTFIREKDNWLPCGYSGFVDMYGKDRGYSNASNIFDCTCSKLPVP